MNQFYLPILMTVVLYVTGCKKYLEAPVTNNVWEIKSVSDGLLLLNDIEFLNEVISATELSADDFFYNPGKEKKLTPLEFKMYTWEENVYAGEKNIRDYDHAYRQLRRINEILNALVRMEIKPAEGEDYNYLKGSCYFYRAFINYNLLQMYARPYSANSAATDTGIVIVLTPNNEGPFVRSTMQQSYQQQIADLTKASNLLPLLPDNINRTRPSKIASWGLLARYFLSMREYRLAKIYADSCLTNYSSLQNFNDSIHLKSYPFKENNSEVIFQAYLNPKYKPVFGKYASDTYIDTTLLKTYDKNDLRKILFFREENGKYLLNGSYTGNAFCFGGIATDEMMLISAECAARENHVEEAVKLLNVLLVNRYREGTFIPLVIGNTDSALQTVLAERRKELAFRGLRWTDLRRLNKENPVLYLRRIIDGKLYELVPNDLRYTFPYPDDVIAGSRIVQNPRR